MHLDIRKHIVLKTISITETTALSEYLESPPTLVLLSILCSVLFICTESVARRLDFFLKKKSSSRLSNIHRTKILQSAFPLSLLFLLVCFHVHKMETKENMFPTYKIFVFACTPSPWLWLPKLYCDRTLQGSIISPCCPHRLDLGSP